MILIKRVIPLTALVACLPCPVLAHTGVGGTQGLLTGFVHPVGGLDHILAMIGVGLLAARLGRRALWLMPLAFVTMMAVGGVAGFSGVTLPFVETVIAASVIVIGLALALRLSLPVASAAAVVGFFAIFHGYAHGAEMPSDASGLAYGAGFVVATALLHGVGIGLGQAFGHLGRTSKLRIAEAGGGAMAVVGALLLAGIF